jgi:histidine kinase/DNA gyrase B/HSP90-like ATPase
MGETRVDLLHLLEDLRDAYPGSTEETILTEIIANALDSGARRIAIDTDASAPAVTIADDGAGMRRRELARYHDIAASTKVRGAGIGFAGVGIKIALLVCAEVLTETRRRGHHVASAWRLASRQKAPWRWVPPPGLVADHGTAVRLILANALSLLVDPGFIEASLRRNFHPLFEPALGDILRDHYPRGVVFVLNSRALETHDSSAYVIAPVMIRLGRKRRPAGAGYLVRDAAPLPEDLRGVAISTFGKVIKRGWDWLGLTPGAPEHVGGLIEVPALAECLALNKIDFIRAGARGATYLAYRKAIQEAVSQQLAEWGDASESTERARRRGARPVERDLELVLADLADDFPLLSSLVEQRAGGQRRLAVAGPRAWSDEAAGPCLAAQEPAIASAPPQPAEASDAPEAAAPDGSTATAPTSPAVGHVAGGMRHRRAARYGLSIAFESRPEEPELAHLLESTVWVNEAHPAYRRAVASRSEGYHVALAVALALAPLAVDPAKEHAFITAFLARWGAAIERRKPRSRS